jgi:hypothetical protein
VLTVLLVLLPALAAWATNDDYPGGGPFIDGWQGQLVTDPNDRDIGQFRGWKQMFWHQHAATITLHMYRRLDANGVLIVTETGTQNAQSLSAPGAIVNGPAETPAGTGCSEHSYYAAEWTGQDLGSLGSMDWEFWCKTGARDPGVYEADWSVAISGFAASTYSFTSKAYHTDFKTYGCIFNFVDSGGNIVPCTVDILAPWAIWRGWNTTVAGTGQFTAQLPPQLYVLQVNPSDSTHYQTVSKWQVFVGDNPNNATHVHLPGSQGGGDRRLRNGLRNSQRCGERLQRQRADCRRDGPMWYGDGLHG